MNPFAVFYTNGSLDSLLHCIAGSSVEYPTERQVWDAAMDLLALDTLVLYFVTSYIKLMVKNEQ
jgi:hypothetical protein